MILEWTSPLSLTNTKKSLIFLLEIRWNTRGENNQNY